MITELQLPSDRFFNATYSGLKQKNFIYGKNGTGKSTLSAAIMGNPNYEVTKGEILFDGVNIRFIPRYS